jgi:steroid 5-alpha reductase family enzyme
MAPLIVVLITAAVGCAFAWTASLVTGDTSWVDRMWSIVPVIYLWEFAGAAHLHSARLNAMAVVVTLWGIRLTYNFSRKGGYSGVEDYRWAVLRGSMSKWQFQLFNLFFIVLYQNALLVLISLPAWTAYQHRSRSFNAVDVFLCVLFLAFTVAETVADQQQWNFQISKRALVESGTTPAQNFVQTGLFRFSRHPNYFFEIAQWWVLFFFGVVAAKSLMQWTVIGPVLLTLLFIGSTRFTEKISLSHYPEYAQYQRSTSAVIPWFPFRGVLVVQVPPTN